MGTLTATLNEKYTYRSSYNTWGNGELKSGAWRNENATTTDYRTGLAIFKYNDENAQSILRFANITAIQFTMTFNAGAGNNVTKKFTLYSSNYQTFSNTHTGDQYRKTALTTISGSNMGSGTKTVTLSDDALTNVVKQLKNGDVAFCIYDDDKQEINTNNYDSDNKGYYSNNYLGITNWTITITYTPTYSITLNKDQGVSEVTGSGEGKIAGSSYTIEAVLNKGYVFKNWTGYTTSTDNPYSFTMPAENINFRANTIPTLKITYYSNEATEIKYKNEIYSETELNAIESTYRADTSYEYGLFNGNNSNGIFLSKTGYQLTGNWLIGTPSGEPVSWSIGGTGEEIAQLIGTTLEDGAKERSVYAEWEPTPYTITYYLNGGTNPNTAQSEYTIISNTYILPTPTKTGYTFLGWYDNSSFSGNVITQIPKGSYGNKEFYAKWKINGLVQIYINNEWKKAIPYVYTSNGWQQAAPYIYNGSNWELCGE